MRRTNISFILAAAAMLAALPARACPGEMAVEAARDSQHAARDAYRACQRRHPDDWELECEAAFLADQQASRAYAALLLWRAESVACAASAPGEGGEAASHRLPRP